MLLLAKIIGGFCTVAIPVGVCGAQVVLTNREQEDQIKTIKSEIEKTKTSLENSQANYSKEIKRITSEKNALATTKDELTYKPIAIQAKITELNSAKEEYESKHKEIQTQITSAINTHSSAVTAAKTAIESLWTDEKSRVEAIATNLATKITNAKTANSTLITSIETTKDDIDKAINAIFYTPITR